MISSITFALTNQTIRIDLLQKIHFRWSDQRWSKPNEYVEKYEKFFPSSNFMNSFERLACDVCYVYKMP